MHIYNLLFCSFFLSAPLSLVFSDESFFQNSACCNFKGPDLKDIEYIIVIRVNNKVLIGYNSTTGNWTGYTEFGMETAEHWNKYQTETFYKKLQCTDNIHSVKQTLGLIAKPTVRLSSVKRPGGGQPARLVCSAYNFYPKQIQVTWLRNGQEETSVVSSSDVMSDGNWNYQVHSYLEYTPGPGEKITCMVEHFSLSEPMLQVWDTSLPQSEQIKIAMGTFLLVLGFVLMSAGFIYYKRRSGALGPLCQGRVLIPVEDLPTAEVSVESEQTPGSLE